MKKATYHRNILNCQVIIIHKYIRGGTEVVAVAYAPGSEPTDDELKALPKSAWRPWNTSFHTWS